MDLSKKMPVLQEKKDEILSSLSFVTLPKKKGAYVCYFSIVTKIEFDGVDCIKTCTYDDVPFGIAVPKEYVEGKFESLKDKCQESCDDEIIVITKGTSLLEAGVGLKEGDRIISSVIGTALPCKLPYINAAADRKWIVGTASEPASRLSFFLAEVEPKCITLKTEYSIR